MEACVEAGVAVAGGCEGGGAEGGQQTLYFMPLTPRCRPHHAQPYAAAYSRPIPACTRDMALGWLGYVWKSVKMDGFEGFSEFSLGRFLQCEALVCLT